MSGDRFRVFRLREGAERGTVRAGFEQASIDDLDRGEVVVKVAYSSVNYKDALAATGKGRIVRRFPCVIGIDLSGTVVSSGDARFRAGQEVIATSFDLGVAHDGGYAAYARVPAGWVVPLPAGMSLFDAMAYGTAGYTAALGIVRMEANDLDPAKGPAIVTGATGGVGSFAVAMLAKRGHHVVALTGKPQERDYLLGLGAKEILLRDSLDLAKIRPLDAAKWGAAVDNLGGPTLAWILSTCQQGAPVASIGLAASADLHTTVMPLILRGVSLLGIDSGYTPMRVRAEVWRRLATDLRVAGLAAMTRTITFDELPSAFDAFIAAQVKGRVVVRIG